MNWALHPRLVDGYAGFSALDVCALHQAEYCKRRGAGFFFNAKAFRGRGRYNMKRTNVLDLLQVIIILTLSVEILSPSIISAQG